MIAGVAALFGLYVGLYAADEFVFHRKRGLHPTARWGHPVDLLLLAATAAYALWVPYGDITKVPFSVLALFALLSPIKDERMHAGHAEGSEQVLHAFRYLLQPLVVIVLGGLWQFLRGVNFMIGMVLPFDPEQLRPIFAGFAGACLALALYQLVYWMVLRKEQPKPQVEATPKAPAPVKAPQPEALQQKEGA